MTDCHRLTDLVARLRDNPIENEEAHEAAAAIEELMAALKPFADMNCQTTDKPGLYSCIVTHKMMADATRAAYRGEKE